MISESDYGTQLSQYLGHLYAVRAAWVTNVRLLRQEKNWPRNRLQHYFQRRAFVRLNQQIVSVFREYNRWRARNGMSPYQGLSVLCPERLILGHADVEVVLCSGRCGHARYTAHTGAVGPAGSVRWRNPQGRLLFTRSDGTHWEQENAR